MHKRLLVLLLILGWSLPAHALTVSYAATGLGNICKIYDTNPVNGLNDCNEISQGNGNPLGVFSLGLSGLPVAATGGAEFQIWVQDADLFGPTGGNTTAEFFSLFIDNLFLGTLFDDSIMDEDAGPAQGLAASVAANILSAGAAPHLLNLNFFLPAASFAPLIADGSLTAFFDFSSDRNTNRFVNPTFSVSYTIEDPGSITAVAIPGSLWGMLMVTAAFGLFVRRRPKRVG